jgi:hypothetical protein
MKYTEMSGGIHAGANSDTLDFGVYWPLFPTHVRCTDNQIKANKYWKVNGQAIYNGSVARFKRAIIMGAMHEACVPAILLMKNVIKAAGIKPNEHRWAVSCTLRTHAGYASVTRTFSKKKGWAVKGGEQVALEKATFDVDNTWIWRKAFVDTMVKEPNLRIFDTDSVSRIASSGDNWIQVPSLEERSITFAFRPTK